MLNVFVGRRMGLVAPRGHLRDLRDRWRELRGDRQRASRRGSRVVCHKAPARVWIPPQQRGSREGEEKVAFDGIAIAERVEAIRFDAEMNDLVS